MPTTAWKIAQTATGWTNSGNVSADDGALATVGSLVAGGYSSYLHAYNFGFTTTDIPVGSSVQGVAFRVKWRRLVGAAAVTAATAVLRFSWGGSDGNNKAGSVPAISDTLTSFTLGGPADTWGATILTLSPDAENEVRTTGFGFSFRVINADATNPVELGIDLIECQVTYTPPPPVSSNLLSIAAAGFTGDGGSPQLRLNHAHPLCAPSRNLVFASFGTGLGGQVLDLSTSARHGVLRMPSSSVTPRAERTLSTALPPNAPPDAPVLALRDAVNGFSAARFDSPQAAALTDNFTVAVWVRPWQLTTFQIPVGTSPDGIGGWNLYSSTDNSGGYAWQLYLYNAATPAAIVMSDTARRGLWNLLVFSRQSSASPPLRFYRDGVERSVSGSVGTPGLTANAAGAVFLGGHDGWSGVFQNQCDIGPVLIWGSVLSDSDIALLYRNTWGLVADDAPPLQYSAVTAGRRPVPAGVSIANNGVVTWNGTTPAGEYSIDVRATNASGSGDGLLGLTIIEQLNPVVTDGAGGAAYGTGGTVTLTATNTPTGWSLPGAVPSGVSIANNGVVTWSNTTPSGTHSIAVRAVNGSGFGDGLLTLTITRVTLTVTATNKTRAYGASNPVFDGTITGFVNGETAAVITGAASYTCAAGAATGVGTAAIVAAAGSLAATNYQFTYVNGTLTITQAALVITPDNKTRVFGAANPTFTGTITGFVNGETAAVLTTQPTYACTADTNTAVGTVAITASGAAATNYSITYGTGTLTITMPVPVVTAASLTRAYGVGGTVTLTATNTPTAWSLTNPPTGVSINNSGVVTVLPTAAVRSGALTVTATNAGGSGTGTLTLVITPITLTVTASDKTRFVGDNNPTLTGVITGFANNETAAVLSGSASYTCSADANSPVGAYTITAAVGTLSSVNYLFTFVNGALLVVEPIKPVIVPLGNPTTLPATAAEILTRTAVVRGAVGVPAELRAVYDALMGSTSDAAAIAARANAFAQLLQDPRYAAMANVGSTTPTGAPGVFLTNVPSAAVVSVDAPADALVAHDGRAELRVAIQISDPGRYQVPGVPSVYVVVHSRPAPFTLDVLVRRAAVITGSIGPGGDSTTARLASLLTPAVCAALFGKTPSGVYADAATLTESNRATDQLAGVLIALVRRIAALR